MQPPETPLRPLLLTRAGHLHRTLRALSTGCGPGKPGGAGRPLPESRAPVCLVPEVAPLQPPLGKGREPRSGTGGGHPLVLSDF